MFNSDSTMVSTEGKNSMLVTKELVEKMTGEYDLRNKHEVKRKVQLQFLRQVIVQLETFLSRLVQTACASAMATDTTYWLGHARSGQS